MSTPASQNTPANTQENTPANTQGNGNPQPVEPIVIVSPVPSRPGTPPNDNGSDHSSDNGSDHSSDNGSDHGHKCPPEPCVPHEFDMTVELKPVVKLCIAKPDVKIKRNNAVCICTPCKDKP